VRGVGSEHVVGGAPLCDHDAMTEPAPDPLHVAVLVLCALGFAIVFAHYVLS
jgi:hypothetical protein